MWLYLILFFIPVFCFLFFQKQRYQNRFLIYFFLLSGIFVGISDMLGGYDRYIYSELFDNVADNMIQENVFDSFIFMQYPTELGYDFLNVVIAYFTANRYVFILILTLIIYALTFISFKRYMSNYPFAVILFMALFFFFTFTYLRQVLSVSIVWLSIHYMIERKFWKFLVIIVIAASFHNAALIFFPMYFLPVKKYTQKTVMIVMVLALIIGILGIANNIYEIYGEISDSEERTGEYVRESGYRIEYLLEAIFFLYFILKKYDMIPHDKIHLIMLNMSLVFCVILLLFAKSLNGGRLSWFFMIGLISTLTFILTEKKQRRRMQTALLMIVVCSFLYVRVYISWQEYLNLYPYKTFFTNGYRIGDYSWEKYEYDHNYDINKFYR